MNLSQIDLKHLESLAINAAKCAGKHIQDNFNELRESQDISQIQLQNKSVGDTQASQVLTKVDVESENIIRNILAPSCEIYELALLSEETPDDGRRHECDYFWCVDPLDGTLAFTKLKEGFAVSIALVSRKGDAVLGVVYNPYQDALYNVVQSKGVFRNGERIDFLDYDSSESYLTVALDQSFIDHSRYDFFYSELEKMAKLMGLLGVNLLEPAGAVVNAIRVLENAPACYFKPSKKNLGGGSLWDFSATSCLLKELGAKISDAEGADLELNRMESTFLNHRGVIISSSDTLAKNIQLILERYRLL